jgi:septal ring factor EnvC (AmiA/AmiB activator)
VSSADLLPGIADELYAGPPSAFTAARDAAARVAAADGDKDLAGRVKALRKPSVAAWAVNLLVRRESDQIDQVLAVGAALREAAAAMDAAEMRALTKQRRQLTAALAATARSLARDEGARLTESVVDQVERVLTAAMLDPVAADVVRTGLLVTAFTSTGVSELDPATVLAVPDAVGTRATPRAAAEPAPPTLRVVPEDDKVRRARAEDALEAATEALRSAESEHDEVEQAVAELDARRLQVHDELDGLRRRIADLEDEADRVEAELEDATEECGEARRTLEEARAGHDEACRRLEELGGRGDG